VAAATGARFIRINVHTGIMFTDQGLLEGRAHETLRARRDLGVPAWILADVLVKHGIPPPGTTLERAAVDCRERGLADVLVVTGSGTGQPAEPEHLRRVKEAVPDAPVWVGSGLSAQSVATVLPLSDGAIVGSAFQRNGVAGADVERGRVEHVMDAVRATRLRC
jgi:membrane complex biogenesis BtpA family protein